MVSSDFFQPSRSYQSFVALIGCSCTCSDVWPLSGFSGTRTSEQSVTQESSDVWLNKSLANSMSVSLDDAPLPMAGSYFHCNGPNSLTNVVAGV